MDVSCLLSIIICAFFSGVILGILDVCSTNNSPKEEIRRYGREAREKMDRISADCKNRVIQILDDKERN